MSKNLITQNHKEVQVNERFLRLHEVKKRTGLSRTTIYDWVKKKKFPKSFHLGERSVAWREHDINAWITQKIKLSK